MTELTHRTTTIIITHSIQQKYSHELRIRNSLLGNLCHVLCRLFKFLNFYNTI